ncbi:MAG: alkaline phosphatase D family protein [Planctomycetota bacterium]|nr:alkaline phosphatase D family protein [Planctomycetota bacterium]
MDIIGPFIGKLTQVSVRIWLHVVDEPAKLPSDHAIEVEGRLFPLTAQGFDLYSVMVADITGLNPGRTYSYRLQRGGKPIELPSCPDLHFATLPSQESETWSFALMSCHNPLEFEKTHAGQGWRVWKAMPDLLWNNKFNANTRFAILGGDQVYTDPKHDELRFSTSDDERRALLIGLYRQFWSDPAYQNVMRNLPAFMMWDDHDIYDGWGSFDINTHSEGGKVDWNGIYSSAKGAFAAFQASRNPDPILPGDNFSFTFVHDNIGFIVPDLRTNRTYSPAQIWSASQRDSVYAWLDTEAKDLDHIFVVSTVTFFHLSKQMDNLVGTGFSFWEWLKTKFLNHQGQDPLDEMADDLRDSWDSDVNQPAMLDFLDRLFDWQNAKLASTGQPRSVFILTGDIHNAGMSDLISHKPAHSKQPFIRQIISSPVAYVSQPKFACALLDGLMEPCTLGGWLTCQHRHLFPQRNFSVISIERTEEGHRRFHVKFYREGIEEPHETVLPVFPQLLERVDWKKYS